MLIFIVILSAVFVWSIENRKPTPTLAQRKFDQEQRDYEVERQLDENLYAAMDAHRND